MRVCFSCREMIHGGAIVSEGNLYHPEHFCCHRCNQALGSGFYVYKVWRLCTGCLPRPACSSNNCSQPDRRIGHNSGTFYRLPVDTKLEPFHSCHTVRCSVCGRGLFCTIGDGVGCDSTDGQLVYHLNDGRPTCSRCYYHLDKYTRWQQTPGKGRKGQPTAEGAKKTKEDRKVERRYRPPLPDEYTGSVASRKPTPAKAAQSQRAKFDQLPDQSPLQKQRPTPQKQQKPQKQQPGEQKRKPKPKKPSRKRRPQKGKSKDGKKGKSASPSKPGKSTSPSKPDKSPSPSRPGKSPSPSKPNNSKQPASKSPSPSRSPSPSTKKPAKVGGEGTPKNAKDKKSGGGGGGGGKKPEKPQKPSGKKKKGKRK